MIKAVIFDCFGVLVGRGFDDTYSYAGGDPEADREFIHDILAQASRGLISQIDFREAIAAKLNISLEDWNKAVVACEQLNEELIAQIKRIKPHYKTAILSNVNSGVLQRKIKPEILDNYFDVIVESAEVGFMKPDTQIYLHTAEQLGVRADECIFIDDNPWFVEAATSVGMRGIVYENFAQMKRELTEVLSNKR